jgi:hypothetical protein
MGILAIRADERVKNVYFTEETISVFGIQGYLMPLPINVQIGKFAGVVMEFIGMTLTRI